MKKSEKTLASVVPVELDFQGTKISCPIENGHKMFPVKTICTILDIQFKVQDEWLKSHPFFSRLYRPDGVVGADGRAREMNCLPIFDVYAWVASVSMNNRREGSIERQYQFLAWIRERTLDFYKSVEATIQENSMEMKMLTLRDETLEQLANSKLATKELSKRLSEIDTAIEQIRFNRVTGQMSLPFDPEDN